MPVGRTDAEFGLLGCSKGRACTSGRRARNTWGNSERSTRPAQPQRALAAHPAPRLRIQRARASLHPGAAWSPALWANGSVGRMRRERSQGRMSGQGTLTTRDQIQYASKQQPVRYTLGLSEGAVPKGPYRPPL